MTGSLPMEGPGLTNQALAQFRAALIARDIVPPDPIVADGRLHRCNAVGRRGRGDVAYLLHLDGIPAGGARELAGRSRLGKLAL